MIRLKPQRLKLYQALRAEHLTYREALEYSRMTKHVPPGGGKPKYPPALGAVVRERRKMWKSFMPEAVDTGWGTPKMRREWHKKVGALYDGLSKRHTGNFFVTKDVHGKKVPMRISPWALYDATFEKLPAEDQWDTPRTGRHSKDAGVSFQSERRFKEKQLREDIRFYREKIKETGDPKGQYAWQLKGLEFRLKRGDY